jgi:hypothetical protein
MNIIVKLFKRAELVTNNSDCLLNKSETLTVCELVIERFHSIQMTWIKLTDNVEEEER